MYVLMSLFQANPAISHLLLQLILPPVLFAYGEEVL